MRALAILLATAYVVAVGILMPGTPRNRAHGPEISVQLAAAPEGSATSGSASAP